MDASDLRVFEAVARLGGMNRAAAELHTVQSNVTNRIRQLEDDLGTRLFHRHSRGVVPTESGLRLLPYAARVQTILEEARRAVADDGAPKGRLAIGTLETTAALRLAPLLSGYLKTHPKVDLVLRAGTTRELCDSVRGRRLEGAFVCGPVQDPMLEAVPIFREELALLAASDGRSLEEILAQQDLRIIVLRAGCSYRERLESLLAGRGVSSPRLLEFGTLEAIFGCVAAGMGVTLLPRTLLGGAWRDGRIAIHDLTREEAEVETVFIRSRDAFESSALSAFIAHVRPVAPVANSPR